MIDFLTGLGGLLSFALYREEVMALGALAFFAAICWAVVRSRLPTAVTLFALSGGLALAGVVVFVLFREG